MIQKAGTVTVTEQQLKNSQEPIIATPRFAAETPEADLFEIAFLEESPDTPLIIRTTGSVGLTPPGYPQAMLYVGNYGTDTDAG